MPASEEAHRALEQTPVRRRQHHPPVASRSSAHSPDNFLSTIQRQLGQSTVRRSEQLNSNRRGANRDQYVNPDDREAIQMNPAYLNLTVESQPHSLEQRTSFINDVLRERQLRRFVLRRQLAYDQLSFVIDTVNPLDLRGQRQLHARFSRLVINNIGRVYELSARHLQQAKQHFFIPEEAVDQLIYKHDGLVVDLLDLTTGLGSFQVSHQLYLSLWIHCLHYIESRCGVGGVIQLPSLTELAGDSLVLVQADHDNMYNALEYELKWDLQRLLQYDIIPATPQRLKEELLAAHRLIEELENPYAIGPVRRTDIYFRQRLREMQTQEGVSDDYRSSVQQIMELLAQRPDSLEPGLDQIRQLLTNLRRHTGRPSDASPLRIQDHERQISSYVTLRLERVLLYETGYGALMSPRQTTIVGAMSGVVGNTVRQEVVSAMDVQNIRDIVLRFVNPVGCRYQNCLILANNYKDQAEIVGDLCNTLFFETYNTLILVAPQYAPGMQHITFRTELESRIITARQNYLDKIRNRLNSEAPRPQILVILKDVHTWPTGTGLEPTETLADWLQLRGEADTLSRTLLLGVGVQGYRPTSYFTATLSPELLVVSQSDFETQLSAELARAAPIMARLTPDSLQRFPSQIHGISMLKNGEVSRSFMRARIALTRTRSSANLDAGYACQVNNYVGIQYMAIVHFSHMLFNMPSTLCVLKKMIAAKPGGINELSRINHVLRGMLAKAAESLVGASGLDVDLGVLLRPAEASWYREQLGHTLTPAEVVHNIAITSVCVEARSACEGHDFGTPRSIHFDSQWARDNELAIAYIMSAHQHAQSPIPAEPSIFGTGLISYKVLALITDFQIRGGDDAHGWAQRMLKPCLTTLNQRPQEGFTGNDTLSQEQLDEIREQVRQEEQGDRALGPDQTFADLNEGQFRLVLYCRNNPIVATGSAWSDRLQPRGFVAQLRTLPQTPLRPHSAPITPVQALGSNCFSILATAYDCDLRFRSFANCQIPYAVCGAVSLRGTLFVDANYTGVDFTRARDLSLPSGVPHEQHLLPPKRVTQETSALIALSHNGKHIARISTDKVLTVTQVETNITIVTLELVSYGQLSGLKWMGDECILVGTCNGLVIVQEVDPVQDAYTFELAKLHFQQAPFQSYFTCAHVTLDASLRVPAIEAELDAGAIRHPSYVGNLHDVSQPRDIVPSADLLKQYEIVFMDTDDLGHYLLLGTRSGYVFCIQLRGLEQGQPMNLIDNPCHISGTNLACGVIACNEYMGMKISAPRFAVVNGPPGDLIVLSLGEEGPNTNKYRRFTNIGSVKTGLPTEFTSIAITPDARWLFASGIGGDPVALVMLQVDTLEQNLGNHTVNALYLRSFKTYTDLTDRFNGLVASAFSLDSCYLFALHTDGVLRVWDVHQRMEVSDQALQCTQYDSGIAFSRLAPLFYVGGCFRRRCNEDEMQRIKLQSIMRLSSSVTKKVRFVTYLHHRTLTAVGYDGTCFVDLHFGARLERTRIPTKAEPLCVCENFAGHEIAIGGRDGCIDIIYFEDLTHSFKSWKRYNSIRYGAISEVAFVRNEEASSSILIVKQEFACTVWSLTHDGLLNAVATTKVPADRRSIFVLDECMPFVFQVQTTNLESAYLGPSCAPPRFQSVEFVEGSLPVGSDVTMRAASNGKALLICPSKNQSSLPRLLYVAIDVTHIIREDEYYTISSYAARAFVKYIITWPCEHTLPYKIVAYDGNESFASLLTDAGTMLCGATTSSSPTHLITDRGGLGATTIYALSQSPSNEFIAWAASHGQIKFFDALYFSANATYN